MTSYRSDDRGDVFVILSSAKTASDELPLGKILRLTTRQREARRVLVEAMITDMQAFADGVGDVVMEVVSTGCWRDWARSELPLHAPGAKAQSYLETKDPVVRTLLKIRHQLVGTICALRAQVEKEPPRE